MHKFTEYHKKPILQIYESEESKYRPFSFGLRKAKLILAHIEAIKEFVEKYEKNL